MKKCTGQEFSGNGVIWLAVKWALRWPRFALWSRLLRWRMFIMNDKLDMVTNMTTLFLLGSSLDVKSLGQLQTLMQEPWPPENSNSRHYYTTFSLVFSILSIIPTVASNMLVLGLKFLTNQSTSSP